MAEVDKTPSVSTSWAKIGRRKYAAYYVAQREKFQVSFNGDKFLTIHEALEAVNARIASLLITDVTTRGLIGVSGEKLEESLKILKSHPKLSTRRTNAMCDNILPTEQQVRVSWIIRLQTGYMETRRTRNTVKGVPVDICEYRMEAFFLKYGKVEALISISGIATGDMELQVTMNRKGF